jgi:hypothetical protein
VTHESDALSRPSLANVVFGTGIVIRYSFYLVGALVIGMIGVAIMSAYNDRTRVIDERPSFYLAATHLSRFTPRTQVVTGGRFGRMELLQYGSFHNRDVNFNIGMGFPPAGAAMTRDFAPQISSLMPGNIRTLMSSNYHDLETRFGSVRATEVRLESDGQWKQCLAFVSRFDTTALYLIGWFCDASGAKPSAATLACTIDKLTLNKDLASKEADTFMRTQAVKPASCSAIPVSQTTDMRSRSNISSPQRWSTPSPTYRRY